MKDNKRLEQLEEMADLSVKKCSHILLAQILFSIVERGGSPRHFIVAFCERHKRHREVTEQFLRAVRGLY